MANDFNEAEFRAKQEKQRRLWATPMIQWTDADLIERLAERYTEDPIPPCRVCGGKLSVQQCGGGAATIWGCSGMKPDDQRVEGESLYRADRRPADDHYSQSRWTQYKGGDTEVLELIRRYGSAAASGVSACAASVPDGKDHPTAREAVSEPYAWMTEDGRTMSAASKAGLVRDGGASASSTKAYSIPLYTRPMEAERDAARYRWMSSRPNIRINFFDGLYRVTDSEFLITDWHDSANAAVDAAMAYEGVKNGD